MQVFLVGLLVALLTVPASAQFGGGMGGGKRHQGQKSTDQAKKPKENLPVLTPVPDNQAAGPFDPWRNVRESTPNKTGKNPI